MSRSIIILMIVMVCLFVIISCKQINQSLPKILKYEDLRPSYTVYLDKFKDDLLFKVWMNLIILTEKEIGDASSVGTISQTNNYEKEILKIAANKIWFERLLKLPHILLFYIKNFGSDVIPIIPLYHSKEEIDQETWIAGIITFPFLPNIKIYDVYFHRDLHQGDREVKGCLIGINVKTKKIYKLWKLSHLNKMIKEANIWIDSKDKALRYFKLMSALPYNNLPHPMRHLNTLDDLLFASDFFMYTDRRSISRELFREATKMGIYDIYEEPKWGSSFFYTSWDDMGKITKANFLRFKKKVKPLKIREYRWGYKISFFAYNLKEDFIFYHARTLNQYEVKIYKNGVIKVNKRHLVISLPNVIFLTIRADSL